MIITLNVNKFKSFRAKNLISSLAFYIFIFIFISVFLIFSAQAEADTIFQLGEEGEEIERLQQRLSLLDFYAGPKTGFFGDQTRRAVEQFQDAAALTPDGAAGPATIAALETAEGREENYPVLEIYSHGPEVILAQYILHQQNYLRVSPSGLFRSLTADAVQNFQSEHNITADGIIGQETWESLLQYPTPKEELNLTTSEVETAREDAEGKETETETEEDETAEGEKEEVAEEQAAADPEQSEVEDNESVRTDAAEESTRSTTARKPILRRDDRGEAVKEAQRLLSSQGFYQGAIDGIYGHQMELAVIKFQKVAGLQVDGVIGPRTWENLTAENGEISQYTVRRGEILWELALRFDTTVDQIKAINNLNSNNIRAGDTLQIPGAGQAVTAEVKELDWWDTVDPMFPRNERAIVTDVETGLSFEVKRYGGTNHADVEPLTSRDTQILRRIYGGSWSWDRRAVVVHIGRHLIAGSINGTPHGGQQIYNNNFPGHICLHFNNSRLHNNGQKDNEHQNNVDRIGDEEWPGY